MTFTTKLILFVSIFFTFIACSKKYDRDKFASNSWNPNLAVPLVYSKFTPEDIVARTNSDELIVVQPETGLLALVYSGQALSFNANEILNLPSRVFTSNFSAQADFNLPIALNFSSSAQSFVSRSFVYDFEADQQIQEVFLSSGILEITASSTIQHNLSLTISFPDFTANGQILSVTIPLNFQNTIPSINSNTIDLSDYLLDFSAFSQGFNEFSVNFNVEIEGTGNPITGQEGLEVNFEFSQLNFHYAKGYLGQPIVGLDEDSILIKLFQNTVDGYFELTNPRLKLKIQNSFGFPVEVDVLELKTINVNSGQSFPMAGFPNPTQVNFPTVMGQIAETQLIFDKNNTSNIINIITPTPKYLNFAFEGRANPQGNTGTPNFIQKESLLQIDADIELTLEGFAFGFEFFDTASFTFEENIDEIEWVKLRLISQNAFPVNLDAQLYLADENLQIIDTLIVENNRVLQSGLVNTEGRVTQASESIVDILIESERVENLLNTSFLILHAEAETLNGPDEEVVKIHEDNFLEFKLGMQVQLNIE